VDATIGLLAKPLRWLSYSLSSSIARPRSTRKLYMDVKDVAGCPNHYHPSRSDYIVVLDACFWR
jgi:hypothetical protein